MKAFLFADIHGNYKQIANIEKFLKNEDIDLILFAGDLINMGEPVSFAKYSVEMIKKTSLPFFWVPGNNDFGRGYFKLDAAFKSLEGKIMELGNRHFTGVGGSPASWAGQYSGESMIEQKVIGGSIFVSHVPPPGILNYRKDDDVHISTSNRKFSNSPLVHICAHIHHQWGVAYLGQTRVIKLAAAESGHYAIMDLENLNVEFSRFS
ncbi:MAG: metallophosphoesterase [Patescibacteria group bacterium]